MIINISFNKNKQYIFIQSFQFFIILINKDSKYLKFNRNFFHYHLLLIYKYNNLHLQSNLINLLQKYQLIQLISHQQKFKFHLYYLFLLKLLIFLIQHLILYLQLIQVNNLYFILSQANKCFQKVKKNIQVYLQTNLLFFQFSLYFILNL
ncbi:hypothetical protein IMG5_033220 [Ichthyophthirius multifiliis]|uniref:Transmembrane protein n=1 Tax=Ichthyophthirius multifiliis TaxID=5932 RepID=G0QLM3_ICHMU|nr:hypothetical protein IMG5_033220 [Ichthyophthirius multifiliis]EGR33883.1 hypothetical protein IMG5_033220 [Ichthyophthirius multifiliis]|eukprot:XP_004039107.1 hypothetical protein IMG5_033220 [Ichthyophthirius multifiliis]